jgi:hypothetical protein
VGAGESKRELKREGEGAACSRVGCSPFIGAGQRQGGGGWAVTAGIMALRLGIQGGCHTPF